MIIAEESEPPETNPSNSSKSSLGSSMIDRQDSNDGINCHSHSTSSFDTDSSFEEIAEMIKESEAKNEDLYIKEIESKMVVEKP